MTNSTQVLEPDITRVVGDVAKCRPDEMGRSVGQVLWRAAVDFWKVWRTLGICKAIYNNIHITAIRAYGEVNA